MKVDRLTSAILDFPSGQSTFTCSTQLVPYQRSHFLATLSANWAGYVRQEGIDKQIDQIGGLGAHNPCVQRKEAK
jgi:hypothetical protein